MHHFNPLIISFVSHVFLFARRASQWNARGILAGNTRGRSSATWGNSQRDYRRRITASPRPDTNWSHATVTGGALECAHGAVSSNTCTFMRVSDSVYRCDVCAPRGNCRLASPPGALRHHKAYGTGVVPVLNPSWNTALRLALPQCRFLPSLRAYACPLCFTCVYRDPRGRLPPNVPGDRGASPLTTAARSLCVAI